MQRVLPVRLNYREYGSGEPLIILHGLFGSSDNWHTLARRLQERRRIIAADLRNHGRSPHADLFTFPAMASDVAELVAALGLPHVDLLGHSLGGKVAMELALSQPELVRRLIVADISPKAYRPHHTELKDAMLALDLHSIGSRKDAERELARTVPNRTVQLFLLKNLTPDEAGGFRWQLNLQGIASSFEETGRPIAGGRRFDGPALFLRGERSDYVDEAADGPLIRSLFPEARIETIAGATHWIHADQPEAVIGAIDRFLGTP